MTAYSTSPLWADITPLPLLETTLPLAAISYTPHYAETTSYLRACMSANEHTPRILALTADLITQNPAHYTVWLYRAETLFALDSDLREELAWLNPIARANQKNYQIWHHRQLVVERLGSVQGEREFTEEMLGLDAKNYHVWSYRQWLVRRFALWRDEGELAFTERLVEEDPRNNSAWNHRWFVLSRASKQHTTTTTTTTTPSSASSSPFPPALLSRELSFATASISRSPQNISAWTYLRALAKHASLPLSHFQDLVAQHANLEDLEGVRSTYALEMLAEMREEDGDREGARRAWDGLAKADAVRERYWVWRRDRVGETG